MKAFFVFSGQGAQTVGMGKDFYETFPVAKAVFDNASPLFPEAKKICFEGDGDTLTKASGDETELPAEDPRLRPDDHGRRRRRVRSGD